MIKSLKLAIFDLDLTLWNGHTLYENTVDILKKLKENNIDLYIASYHLQAKRCCDVLGIADYFSGIHFGRDRNKAAIVEDILSNYTNYHLSQIAFFDDNFNNILDVKNKHKIKTVHVVGGITWSDLN